MKSFPSISVLIPTLNAERYLEECLKSIRSQDYPQENIEIIFADGGSTDNTLKIAKKYKVKVYNNPLKTGEAGKAVALKHAKNELCALIDSDNFLTGKNWLRRMIEPFVNEEILGSEPWIFTYRKTDGYITRYCALIGANDPYCYFVGNYDKFSYLSNKWTGLKMTEEDKGGYIKVKITGEILPTIGANGTIWRTKKLRDAVGESSYLFDTDIPYLLSEKGFFYFSKVKVGIVHIYCHQLKDFYRKQKRRARDFFFLEKKNERQKTYQKQTGKQLLFILSVIFVFPLIFQSIKGYIRKHDRAWLFHPFSCLITLWVYGKESVLAIFKTGQMDRKKWTQ